MHTEYDVRGPAPTIWRRAEFGGGHEQPMDPHRMNRPEFRMPPPPLGGEVFNDSHGHPQAVTTPSRMDGERRQRTRVPTTKTSGAGHSTIFQEIVDATRDAAVSTLLERGGSTSCLPRKPIAGVSEDYSVWVVRYEPVDGHLQKYAT